MTSIRFLSDQVYDTGGPGLGPRFAAGSTVSVADVPSITAGAGDAYCEAWLKRWVNRKVAVYVTDAGEEEATTTEEETPPLDLSTLKKADLEGLAAARKVDISACRTRADIIAALASAA